MDGAWLTAIGLVLFIEGLMPLLAPDAWRQSMQRLARLRDGQLRFVGLAAVVAGLLLASL